VEMFTRLHLSPHRNNTLLLM